MAENHENEGERPMSMKERLLAQRRAAEAQAAPPVPAGRPAPRPAEKPAAAAPPPRPAAPARPASPAPAAPARPAAPAPAAARPSAVSRAGVRALAAPAKPAAERRDVKAMSADVQREVEMLRKQQDKWIKWGWIVAGGMLLIAGAFALYVKTTREGIEKRRVEYEKAINDLVAEVSAIPITTNENANKVIARAEETKKTIRLPSGRDDTGWNDTYIANAKSKISGASSRAMNFIEADRRKKELIDGLAAIETAARDASGMTPEALAQLRRRISEYEAGASLIGPEFETRVAKAKIDINRAYAKRLYDVAKALAAGGPAEARTALVAYTKAEDELRLLMDEAYNLRKQDAIDFVEPLYQQAIAESDALVAALFTPDAIDRIAWKDVLNTPGTEWLNDGLKGFRTEGGVVQAVGSDPGSNRIAIFSVGDRDKWRDFVMEIEFIPVKGASKLYWRLGKLAQAAPDEFLVNTLGDEFKAGQTYTMKITYIGSKRIFEHDPKLELDIDSLEPINWRRNRAGAFGVSLDEGAEFKLTKLRIKVLR